MSYFGSLFKYSGMLETAYKDADVFIQPLFHCVLYVQSWAVAHQAPCPRNFPGKNTRVGCYFLL